MDKYNKRGKIFLVVTIITFLYVLYLSLDASNYNKLTGIQWFILLGTLFTSIINVFRNIKEKKIYYAIGSLLITITLLVFGLVPQLFLYIIKLS